MLLSMRCAARAVILIASLVAGIGACGSPPPPTPTRIPREATLKMKSDRLVAELRVGDTHVFPYTCERSAVPALCTDVGAELREKGCDLYLIDRDDEGDTHKFMFSAECSTNPKCGSYGFWLLIVTPDGMQASPPLNGCFTVTQTHGSIDWQSSTFTPPPGGASGSFPRRFDSATSRWH